MAHVKMQYAELECRCDWHDCLLIKQGRAKRREWKPETVDDLLRQDDYMGINDTWWKCYENDCDGYVPSHFKTDYTDENGVRHIVGTPPCRWYTYREIYREGTYKSFLVEPNDEERADTWLYPYIFKAGKREYLCIYLEIDGHVYCDERDRDKEEIEGEQS